MQKEGAHNVTSVEWNENWYGLAVEELSRLAKDIQQQRDVTLKDIEGIAGGIVQSVVGGDHLVVKALSSPPGPPLITNLVNVAILTTKVGIGLGYYGTELGRLAFAGLMHDIGLFAVPQSLLTKAGRLTAEERGIVERHPELGYRLIEQLGRDYEWLAEVVRQAHERWTGQGYPRNLKGRQINEFAQIIGVVDVFDALVSPRPYRRRLLPHEAVRELLITERSAFPREVVKALVEQLSVYPLGTTVRLNTGDVGVVTRTNPSYPLRPVLSLSHGSERTSVHARLLDLSLTPHVSIIETIDPPAMDRVTFPAPIAAIVPAISKAAVTSDGFTALLESLDAIATQIQTIVESKVVKGQEDSSLHEVTAPPLLRSTMDEIHDASFQKEVIGLFALEAREWLSQIQAVLKKLGGRPSEQLRAKLLDVILHGITNLGRSAITVQLPTIEQMASSLVPILHAVGNQGFIVTADQFSSLSQGLERIAAAVQRLTGEPPVCVDTSRQTGHTDHAQEKQWRDSVAAPSRVGSPPILDALRELHRARTRSMEPIRDVLETVIQRADSEQERSTAPIDVHAIGRILKDLDDLETHFLVDVQTRVPVILQTVSALKTNNGGSPLSQESLEPILAEVEALYEAARRVNASTIMQFLQGLRTFLMVAAYRKISLAVHRLEAVESRLEALVSMAQQWVDVGRIERTTIGEILPT
ncbi:MAG: HD-GYP domain-containing protein [Nitrospiraceae bacterium]